MVIETSDIGRINENLYVEIFKSRDDCYAIQRNDGSYAPADREFTTEIAEHHITGEYTTGQYVVDPRSNTVKFACIDNDVDEEGVDLGRALDAALDERTAARSLGLKKKHCWIEFSGRRGYHLWVFFEHKVPAVHAKRLMEEIVSEATPDDGELIEGGHTEVFPKQIVLNEIDYGNLVKTPLGFHQQTGNRMLFVDDYGEPFDEQGDLLRPIARNRVTGPQLEQIVEDFGADLEELEEQVEEQATSRGDPIDTDRNIEIRPCIEKAMEGETPDDLRGDQGHFMRLALASEMVNAGMSMDEMIEVYRQFDNFDLQVTREKLREVKKEGHKPWQCSTLQDKCPRYCADCPCPYQDIDTVTSIELNRKQFGDEWEDNDE